jgi:para-nitrobenzyl esterase
MNTRKLASLGLCALFGTVVSSHATFAAEITKITSGELKGVKQGSVIAYKGIPFAKPPIGELRWRAPQPVESWQGVRDTSQYGHDCMQLPFPSDAAPLGTTPAEDCLVLNVWKPEKVQDGAKLPVMVWIYGGGFVNGGSSPEVYSGAKFAEQNVVAVSFNYRVGRFGFFAHPALSAENLDSALGNYGFMDQIAALQWVKANIAQFGGDPTRVTLVGESAGGFSIHSLLTSPMAQGLFEQAIIQSGGGRTGIGQRYVERTNALGQSSAESVGIEFAKYFSIQGDGLDALNKLRALPAEDIVNGLNMATMMDPTYAGPMIDGKLVVDDPQHIYSQGKGLNLPLMVGTTDAEIGFPPQVSSMKEALAPFGEAKLKEAEVAFTAGKVVAPQVVAQALASDLLMVEPGRFVLQQAAKQGKPIYAYRFGYVADSVKKEWPGAFHATDIPYAFNTVAAKYGNTLTDSDMAMGKLVNQYWVNFIKSGNPNGTDLPQWTPYKVGSDNLMMFSNQGVKATGMLSDPWKARLDLVEALQAK